MKILSIEKYSENEIIEVATEEIRKDNAIVIPTDTVYGIACDPFSISAVKKVWAIKRVVKPMPILCSSIDEVTMILSRVSSKMQLFMDYVWPGPVTIVYYGSKFAPLFLSTPPCKVAVRIPDHNFLLKLISEIGGFLVGTSANIYGAPPPRSIKELDPAILHDVPLAIDAGSAKWGLSSTVVDLTCSPPKIVREGPLTTDIKLLLYNLFT